MKANQFNLSILCLFILLNFYLTGFSQLVNSNQNNIAEFYDGKAKRIEFNGAKVTAQLKIYGFPTPYRYKRDTAITSAVKNNTFFVNLGLTNTKNDFLNLNKFDFKKITVLSWEQLFSILLVRFI